MSSITTMPLCQVALSTMDLPRTSQWYQRVFGCRPSGRPAHHEGAIWAEVPGLPEAAFTVSWLLDAQDMMQIELFEFERPRMHRIPKDWTPCDHGYAVIGVHVTDFDATMAGLLAFGGRPFAAAVGGAGRRRVCVRDPDGILLEVMEDCAPSPGAVVRPEIPSSLRSVTVSVANLDAAARFWLDTLGFREASETLHSDEHGALWGLAQSQRETLLVDCESLFVELVQYSQPQGRPKPAGYLASDQGIFNVALGSTDKDRFDAVFERVVGAGYPIERDPLTVEGIATVVYVRDKFGLSVELVHVEPQALQRMGFADGPTFPIPTRGER